MSKLNQLNLEALRELIGYRAHTAGGLAINTAGAATFKTANTVVFTNDGVFKSKTAFSAQAFTAGHTAQKAGETGYYVVALDGSGNVKTFQSISASVLPDVDDGYTPIGLIKVVCGSAAFTPGTTALDASNITFTFYDLSVIPSAAP